MTNTIPVETLISEIAETIDKELPQLGTTRAFWKKYCVETCYGFWNPVLWNKKLATELQKRTKQRQPYYDEIKSIIEENDSEIKRAFIELCERVQVYLTRQGITDWRYGEIENAIEAWGNWYGNLRDKLNNKDFYKRLVSGISSVPSPDVWNDSLSSEEFEDSFYKSVIYHWSKEYSRETTNVIAQAIACNLGIGSIEKERMKNSELKENMDKWLSENPELSIVDFNEEE